MNNAAKNEKISLWLFIVIMVVFAFLYFVRFDEIRITEEIRIFHELSVKRKQDAARNLLLEKADYLYRGYFYDEAVDLLNSYENLANEETLTLIEKINGTKNNLVKFEGVVKHIFFHSLILYPEYLFTDLAKTGGLYGSAFVYLSELKRILPQLMERGYVLYDINDVFGKDENGVMRYKDIYLPPGKMPLVLSVDDPSYHYGVGFASRMIVDDKGRLATEVTTPEGKNIVTYDGDVELVVNDFVEEHPEFSYRGAKGVVATTGYLGFFGHRLWTRESQRQAKAVADKLKETGWLFASHSYGHNGTGWFGPNSVPENVASDTREWKWRIEPITGKTNIFISPFGTLLTGDSLEVILRNGFDIYCDVNFVQVTRVYDRFVVMSRIEIGGYTFRHFKELLNNNYFDVDFVKDKHRPRVAGYGT
jgi:hypothetical protein